MSYEQNTDLIKNRFFYFPDFFLSLGGVGYLSPQPVIMDPPGRFLRAGRLFQPPRKRRPTVIQAQSMIQGFRIQISQN